MKMRLLGACAVLSLVCASITVWPVSAEKLPDANTGGRPFTTSLLGSNEVPGPGDEDGSGVARLTLNPGQEEVCFEITVSDVETITAAHIHRGASDVAGPVVVNFDVPNNGLIGCVNANRALIKEILQNPSAFYVNVHNAPFPAGALRGQLTK